MLIIKCFLYYQMEHYHCTQLFKCRRKQMKYFDNTKKFKKYGKKFIRHCECFDAWNARLDKLKEKIENNYMI